MSSLQGADLHLLDVLVGAEHSLENGREYSWYLPSSMRLHQKCNEVSTAEQRLMSAPQAEFCKYAEVIEKDTPGGAPVKNYRELLRTGNPGTGPQNPVVNLPPDDPQFRDFANTVLLNEQVGFNEQVNQISASISRVTHTTADGKLRTKGTDSHIRPDFVVYYMKKSRAKDLRKAKLLPWMIVEVKPPPEEDGSEYIYGDNGFGSYSKHEAQTKMWATTGQTLDQVTFAFHEHHMLETLFVLICVGPFFEFFRVTRRNVYRKRKEDRFLYTLSSNKKAIEVEFLDAKCLFSDDLKSFNPEFDMLWKKTLDQTRWST